jgi:hypothetical protein
MLDLNEDKKKVINLISDTIKQKTFSVGGVQQEKESLIQEMVYPRQFLIDWKVL